MYIIVRKLNPLHFIYQENTWNGSGPQAQVSP